MILQNKECKMKVAHLNLKRKGLKFYVLGMKK